MIKADNISMKQKNLTPKTIQDFFPNAPTPLLFAHRGCSTRYPENTLLAFEAALKNNIKALELDVHLTKDNKLVIIHDGNCQRTTGKSYQISKTKFSALRELNAAFTFNKNGSTNCKVADLISVPKKEIVTPIPTLEELFKLGGDSFIYDIEVKVKRKLRITLKLIDRLAKKYALSHQIILSSFNPFTVAIANRLSFKATALIYGEEEDNHCAMVSKFLRFIKKKIARPTMLKPRRDHAINENKNELNRLCKNKQNRVVATWTVDDKDEAKRLMENGVLGLCSNHPEDLLR